MEKVYDILSSFDRAKKVAFEKYIQSSYFNPQQNFSKTTWDWIKEIFKNQDFKTLQSQLPEPSAKDKKLLFNLSLDFLSQYAFDELTTMKANLNLEGIRKRNIEKLYKDTLAHIEKLQTTELDQSSEYFYYRSLIEKNIFELKTENEKKNAKVKIASELNMHKISENVDLFYILEIMKNVVHDYSIAGVQIKTLESSPELKFAMSTALQYENQYVVVGLYRQFIENILFSKFDLRHWTQWYNELNKFSFKIPQEEISLFREAFKKYIQTKEFNKEIKISLEKMVF